MNSQTPGQISVFTKISLIANVVLFAVIGVIYLMEDRNLVAVILFTASLLNIIWALFAIPVRNLVFAILNFIYTVVAIAIGVDFQLADSPYLAMLWFAIGLIYIIIGFVALLRRKGKSKPLIIVDDNDEIEEEMNALPKEQEL
ncbi:MAG: hypothetical protein DRI89_09955 [Bacteroidetes bacterium]|nr:MAG: hypothetical protein DRI89_09955 [Bacteroidota bacterium]